MRNNAVQKRKAYFHRNFDTLTPESKAALQHLIRDALTGMMFSLLVRFDQPHYLRVVLRGTLTGDESGQELVDLLAPGELDLHDEMNDWLLSFSRYGHEIIELKQSRSNWHTSPVEYYLE